MGRDGEGLIEASLTGKRLIFIPFAAPFIIPSFVIDIQRQLPEALICCAATFLLYTWRGGEEARTAIYFGLASPFSLTEPLPCLVLIVPLL